MKTVHDRKKPFYACVSFLKSINKIEKKAFNILNQTENSHKSVRLPVVNHVVGQPVIYINLDDKLIRISGKPSFLVNSKKIKHYKKVGYT